jgi:hypothetical protein
MAKPRNLKQIALAGSGLAGLTGCMDDLSTEVRVQTPESQEFQGTKALYENAFYAGLTLIGAICVYRIFRKDL